jgi:cell division protein FtsB
MEASMRRTLLGFLLAIALGLTACNNTRTVEENERLKAQVAELQKQGGQMGDTIQTLTAERDTLAKENQALKTKAAQKKRSRSVAKASTHKHHQSAATKS